MSKSKCEDARVFAIREDPVVGRGSCSSLDECFEDSEVVEALDKEGVRSPQDAVRWARERERLYLERGCDQRWGEDDDPQLKMLQEFRASCEEYPIKPRVVLEMPVDICPNCGSHKLAIVVDGPHRPRVQSCRCDVCSLEWDEPCPVHMMEINVAYDDHSAPDFPRVLRMLADELEKIDLTRDGWGDGWGDVPKYPGAKYRGSWVHKKNI